MNVGDALPLGIRLGGRIFVDEIRLPIARFPGVDFLFRFAVHFFHLLDCHGHKLSNVFVICACDLGVYDRVRIGPGRSFRIKNAWQSLLGSGAVIENPAWRRIDLERSLGTVNDSTRKRLLGENTAASYKQGEPKKKIVFIIGAQFGRCSVKSILFSRQLLIFWREVSRAVQFLLNLPPPISFFIVSAITTSFALAGLYLVRRKYSAEVLKENHEVAAIIFNAFGLFYGVLLAFVVFVTWSGYDDATKNLQLEANEVVDIFHITKVFPDPAGEMIRQTLMDYVTSVYNDELKRMSQGEISLHSNEAMQKLITVFYQIDEKSVPNRRDLR